MVDFSFKICKRLLYLFNYFMCAYRLKHFDKILWFDSNPNIQNQLCILIFVFQEQLEMITQVPDYKTYIEDGSKFLVVCSSKLIQDVYKQFRDNDKIYQKFIVFCGSPQRMHEIKSNHPLRQAIEDVFYDPADVINGITLLQQRITKNKALLHQKVVITIPKIEVNTIPVVYESPTTKNLHQQAHQKSYYQKPPAENEIKGEKKVQQQQVKIENVKRKAHEKYKICWVVEEVCSAQIEAIKKKYTQKLERVGYPVDLIDTEQTIKFDENDNPNLFYIILTQNLDVNEVKSSMNNLKLLIRVVQGLQDSISGEENEKLVCSLEDIIKQLDEANLQEQPN